MCWTANFNNMKRYFYILLLGLISLNAVAQDEDVPQQDDQTAKEKIKAARIGLITQRLGLTPEQAEKFWPIYNEFASKRQELVKQYREAERSAPASKDPKQQEALVNLGLKLKQDEVALEKEYSGKMLDVISAQQILNLRQAERDFRKIILNQLQQRRILQDRRENFRDRNMRLRERKH
jgi:Spy/CpxP family protein refolding chaperone